MTKFGRVSRGASARVLICAVALFVLSAGPIIVNSAADAAEGEEAAALPTAADLLAGVRQVEKEEEEREEELASASAIEERDQSEHAYKDASPIDAIDLLRTSFPEELALINADPARYLSDAILLQPLGNGTAGQVISDGSAELLDAGIPVVAAESGGEVGKVDLSLVDAGETFESINPLVDIGLPQSANQRVTIGDEDLAVTAVGASPESDAIPFGDKNLFYPDTSSDTDLLISPVAGGVEFSSQLRSIDSPEHLRFQLDLPEGAELQSDGNGGADIVRGSEITAHVPFPTAVDAQGSSVPVELGIDGSTLLLDVPHRAQDYAYPILVDPSIVEDWYNSSWYSGANLGALNTTNWQWSPASTPAWIYHDFKCIFTCWGSGRGLYISAESGWHPANQWGQFTYTPPGASSFITSALLNPFWRNNYENCPKSKYPQPHDYDGLWTGTGWAPLEMNRANDYGNANPIGTGRSLIIGLGTAESGAEDKCRRDVMAGGVAIWVTDSDVPVLSKPTVADQWIDTTSIPISVSANDGGLGVKYFKLFVTKEDGTVAGEIGSATNSCTGLKSNACPSSWSTQISNYSTSGLPGGINTLAVKAYDALGEAHMSSGQPVKLKIDRSAPWINIDGNMFPPRDPANPGPPPAKYHLDITGKDGNAESMKSAQSGMKSFDFYWDGVYEGSYPPETPNPPPCSNVQQGVNLGSCEFQLGLDFSRSIVGKHTFKVVAKDSLNHVTEQTAQLELPLDTTAPTISPSGALYGSANYWTYAKYLPLSLVASDQETGVVEETVTVDGSVVYQSGQECFYGGCEMTRALEVNLQGLAHGPHQVKAMAKDGAGNVGQASWTVYRDTTLPTLAPLSAPELSTGWTPQLSTFNLKYSAADTGAGIQRIEVLRPLPNGSWDVQVPWSSSCAGSLTSPCPETKEGTVAINTAGMAEGEVNLTVKAYDTASNVVTRTLTVKSDHSAPQVSGTGPLATNEASEVVGTSSELGLKVQDKGSGVSSVDLSLDGEVQQTMMLEEMLEDGGTQVCASGTCSFTYNLTAVLGDGAAPGTHTFVLSVHDNAGNTRTITRQVMLDTRPPEVELSGALVDAIGKVLPGTTGTLKIDVGDGSGGTGVAAITVEVNGVPAQPKVAMWVVDKSNNRLQGFDAKGRYVTQFGSFGSGNGQFNRPAAAAVDSAGNVWVADANNNRIEKFNEKGEYLTKFGAYGTGNGQLNGPEGVSLDAAGSIWVSDTYNGRLQKFNAQGEFVKVVGSKGSAQGQLGEPTGIDIAPDGKVWVADWQNNRISVFTAEGSFVRQFGSAGAGNGQFNRPDEVEVDGKGRVWVGDQNNGRVQQFTESGTYVTQFGSKGSGAGQFSFAYPIGLAIDSKDQIWVSDTNNDRVQKWAVRNYSSSYQSSFASSGHPGDVAVDSVGNVWAVSSYGNQLRKYDPDGQLLLTVGGGGSADGKFSGPAALAIDAQNNIWVADRLNNRVQKFGPQGEFLLKFGSAGGGNGQFNGPEGIAIDQKGNIWVSDTYNGRVQKFSSQGQFLKVAVSNGSAAGKITEPVGIDVAPDGKVWIADWQGERVVVVDEEGGFVRQLGSMGSGPGQFREPDGVDVDAQGNVWVGDANNERIQEFRENGSYVGQFGSPGSGEAQFSFNYPMGLDVGSTGSMWVADTENNRIQRWKTPTYVPTYIEAIGSSGTANGGFSKPADIAMAPTVGCMIGTCPEKSATEYTYSEEKWGSGSHSVVVTATDAAGNTNSEEVRVNDPLNVVAPSCPSAQPNTLNGGQALGAAAAVAGIEAALPKALAPSEPFEEEEGEISGADLDPGVTQALDGVSINEMGIDVRDTLMGGGVEEAQAGAFTIGQTTCLQPMETTSAASAPAVVEESAVVFPNAAPDTDTVVRPTAFGTSIIERLRGPEAPDEFSWVVKLKEKEELVELENGSIATIIPDGPDLEGEEIPAAPAGGPETLNDANVQVEQAEHELAVANNEVEGEVTMVLAAPEVVLSSGQVISGIFKISSASVIKAELPPNTISEAEAMIIRANPAAQAETMCDVIVATAPQYAGVVCGPEYEEEGIDEEEPSEELQNLAQGPNPELNSSLLSQISHYEAAVSGGGAQASSSGSSGVTDEQKRFCRPSWRKTECQAFLLDGLEAAEVENVLFNVPEGSNGTRANAFRHTFWVALMRGSESHEMDGLAFSLAHEEKEWKSTHTKIARESKMDVLNDFVGHLRAGSSDLNSCEIMLEKSIHAFFIAAKKNPFKWAHEHGYEYYRPVYRKLRDIGRTGATGYTVLSTGRSCKSILN